MRIFIVTKTKEKMCALGAKDKQVRPVMVAITVLNSIFINFAVKYLYMENLYIGIYDFASPEYDEAVSLRYEVLRKPLGLEFSAEQLAEEYKDVHIGAWTAGGMVGTLTMTKLDQNVVKMRQVAVSEVVQSKGVGSALVHFSEHWALSNGFTKLVLHARDIAVPFYKKLGYDSIGDAFVEVGIAHQKMGKEL
ncbi:MAG: GNAT family N-acetyltransferase [Saprospiraceae bacterium]|nr:GNAT family N-acetyltransferase [Saprospiraceae bacterium]MBK8110220.1 GNAT family N-acetyltransferase [Saprospiraceae bacterium]